MAKSTSSKKPIRNAAQPKKPTAAPVGKFKPNRRLVAVVGTNS